LSYKKKWPDTVKLNPVDHFLKPTKQELKSKDGLIFLEFIKAHKRIKFSLGTIETLWSFIKFLRANGYYIVKENTVFCVPFSQLVDQSELK
jgi:hypothetical protein